MTSRLAGSGTADSHATSYRPEIDGLRAVAVLAVVFYHVGLGFPGGYVGVDVFFVISGYLITAIVLRDLERGCFSLAGFWERRVRRIAPALSVMIAATMVAGWFLLLPDDLETLGSSAVAQSLCVANIYFWRTTNYFGGANEEKPLLHTWSLAVEEQFYLFFPILLMMIYRSAFLRRHLLVILTTLAAMSLGLSIWALKPQPYATFFLLPTRAWELLLGAIVASLPAQWFLSSRLGRECLSVLGVLLVIVPMFVYGESTPFPGAAALAPCLGAVALIWGNQPSDRGARTKIAAMLSFKPIVFFGLISYSLYLWHWPVIAFALYWKTAPLSVWSKSGLVSLSFVLGILSWYFVERRFRMIHARESKKPLYTFFSASIVCFLATGLLFKHFEGIPERIPISARDILEVLEENSLSPTRGTRITANSSLDSVKANMLSPLGYTGSGATRRVLVAGDSHARSAISAFCKYGAEFRIPVVAITYQSTPPLLKWNYCSRLGAPNAEALWTAARAYVLRHEITDVFLVAYWSDYEQQGSAAELIASIEYTATVFKTAGARTWVLMDAPTYDEDVVKSIVKKMVFPWLPSAQASITESQHRYKNSALYSMKGTCRDIRFLDPSPFLFNAETGTYSVLDGKFPYYSDSNHLSTWGVEKAINPLVESAFRELSQTAVDDGR